MGFIEILNIVKIVTCLILTLKTVRITTVRNCLLKVCKKRVNGGLFSTMFIGIQDFRLHE